MATELAPVEGLQYAATNVMSGATVYAGLIYGQTVAAGQITSSSTLATLQEENGTSYARAQITLGVASQGIMLVPGNDWNAGNHSNWHSTVKACFIASALTGGVAIFIWDLGLTADMSLPFSDLAIPAVNYFLQNPGGI